MKKRIERSGKEQKDLESTPLLETYHVSHSETLIDRTENLDTGVWYTLRQQAQEIIEELEDLETEKAGLYRQELEEMIDRIGYLETEKDIDAGKEDMSRQELKQMLVIIRELNSGISRMLLRQSEETLDRLRRQFRYLMIGGYSVV